MSIFIDWSLILEDAESIEAALCDHLHRQFQRLKLPPFIEALAVSSLKLGSSAPEVTIRHISDPFPEFYEVHTAAEPQSCEAAAGAGKDQEVHTPTGQSPPHAKTQQPSFSDPILGPEDAQFRPEPVDTDRNTAQPTGQSFSTPTLAALREETRKGGSLDFSEFDQTVDIDAADLMGFASSTGGYRFGRHSTPVGLLNYSRLGRMMSAEQQSPVVDSFERVSPEPQDAPGPPPEASPFDVQMLVEFKYKGDMQLGVTATLHVSYPSPNFITIPVALKVTNIDIHILVAIALIKNCVHISILCDIDDENNMSSEEVVVVQNMKLESEIGYGDGDQDAVLRNVVKVERFILEQLRRVIREELVWPGWITIEL